MFKTIEINRLKNVETAIILALVLLIVSWKYQDWRFVLAASVVMLLGLIMPIVFYPLAKIWFGLGLLLGFFTTKILLTIIFFIIVTPVGLIRKWMGRDTLSLKNFKKDDSTTLVSRNHKFVPEDLNNPF